MVLKLTKDKTVQAACLLDNGYRGLLADSVDCLADTDYELSYVFGFDFKKHASPTGSRTGFAASFPAKGMFASTVLAALLTARTKSLTQA